MVPLSRPIMLTLAIFSFQWRWNDYIWPLLVLNDPSKFTVQLGIETIVGAQNIDWSGAARRVGHLNNPADRHLPRVPEVRHERQHQHRPEKLNPVIDREFARAVAVAADRFAAPDTAEHHEVSHRELMRLVKTLVAAYRCPDSAMCGSERALTAARRHLLALRALQTPSGLFAGGDNVQSPPDSAFTVNDVCDAFVLADGGGAGLGDLALMLAEIARAASGALLVGGVHAPNHRWEAPVRPWPGCTGHSPTAVTSSASSSG